MRIIAGLLIRLCTDTFQAWIPLVWFQQVHQPYVTPGNRAAAVVASFNIVVFSIIAILSHKEKLAKKRNHQLSSAPDLSQAQRPSDESNNVKGPALGISAIQPEGLEAAGRPI